MARRSSQTEQVDEFQRAGIGPGGARVMICLMHSKRSEAACVVRAPVCSSSVLVHAPRERKVLAHPGAGTGRFSALPVRATTGPISPAVCQSPLLSQRC